MQKWIYLSAPLLVFFRVVCAGDGFGRAAGRTEGDFWHASQCENASADSISMRKTETFRKQSQSTLPYQKKYGAQICNI